MVSKAKFQLIYLMLCAVGVLALTDCRHRHKKKHFEDEVQSETQTQSATSNGEESEATKEATSSKKGAKVGWQDVKVVEDKPSNCKFIEDIWIERPWLFEFTGKQLAKKVEDYMKKNTAKLGGDTVYIKDIDLDGHKGAKAKGKAYRCNK